MDVRDALAQVRRMQDILQERRLFRGYSGRARLFSGGLALAGAAVLASGRVPATPRAQLAGWLLILALALLANYGALAWWFFSRRGAGRNLAALAPAREALAPLALGGLLTLALMRAGATDLLFGAWMACYGLAHLPYRLTLPRANYALGLGYFACGAALLLAPGVRLLNPWPMGLIFFVGETIGGFVLLHDHGNDRTSTHE